MEEERGTLERRGKESEIVMERRGYKRGETWWGREPEA